MLRRSRNLGGVTAILVTLVMLAYSSRCRRQRKRNASQGNDFPVLRGKKKSSGKLLSISSSVIVELDHLRLHSAEAVTFTKFAGSVLRVKKSSLIYVSLPATTLLYAPATS